MKRTLQEAADAAGGRLIGDERGCHQNAAGSIQAQRVGFHTGARRIGEDDLGHRGRLRYVGRLNGDELTRLGGSREGRLG